MEVVRWLSENDKHKAAKIIIHSMNHPAARKMELELLQAGYLAKCIVYTTVIGVLTRAY
jgi:hypothetical protein